MAEQKPIRLCLTAQEAYPEARRATLTTAPPIGYVLRVERETSDAVLRCIYSVADGQKIHDGRCRFEGISDTSNVEAAKPEGDEMKEPLPNEP